MGIFSSSPTKRANRKSVEEAIEKSGLPKEKRAYLKGAVDDLVKKGGIREKDLDKRLDELSKDPKDAIGLDDASKARKSFSGLYQDQENSGK